MQEQEIWKDVIGYEGLYQVSNLGRVRTLRTNTGDDGIMYQRKKKNGYMIVQFRIGNVVYTHSVHRLVALAFIPNPENKPEIDHIDGNPSNNIITNLKWATPKENSNNPVTIARKKAIMSIVNQRNVGKQLSPETKKKISDARLGRFLGVNNPFFGKRHSEEARKIMSQRRKERGGIPVAQYTKEGLFLKVWECAAIAGHVLKISPSSITACCRGKRKTIGGYTWKYQSDVKK